MQISTTTQIDASTTVTVMQTDQGLFYVQSIALWLAIAVLVVALIQKFTR